MGHLAFGGGGQKDTLPLLARFSDALTMSHMLDCKDQVSPPVCAPLNLKGDLFFSVLLRALLYDCAVLSPKRLAL